MQQIRKSKNQENVELSSNYEHFFLNPEKLLWIPTIQMLRHYGH